MTMMMAGSRWQPLVAFTGYLLGSAAYLQACSRTARADPRVGEGARAAYDRHLTRALCRLVLLLGCLLLLRQTLLRGCPPLLLFDLLLLAAFHHLFWHGVVAHHSPAVGVGAAATPAEVAALVRVELFWTWAFAVPVAVVALVGTGPLGGQSPWGQTPQA